MTDKDPKDMTVSEQLRWAANGEPYNGIDGNIWTYPTGKIRALAEAVTGEWPSDNEIFSIVADKIDAEIVKAYSEKLNTCAMRWAKANGWPDFKPGEDFGAWLDRCTFAKPLDDRGEPVQIGERAVDKVRGDIDVSRISYTANGFYFNNSHNSNGTRIAHRITYAPGERVKRPAPEVLGADGLPIVKGETTYRTDRPTTEIKILYIRSYDDGSSDVVYCEGDPSLTKMCDPSLITHTPPDTLERLRDDIAEWRADCAIPGSGWDAKTAEWAARIDAIIRRKGGAE